MAVSCFQSKSRYFYAWRRITHESLVPVLCPQIRTEYIDLSGLRLDGRRANEVRRIRCHMGEGGRGDGCAVLEMGNTKILATVDGPRDVTLKSKERHDRATVTVEFSMAAFSQAERKQHSKNDRRSTEMAKALRETFENVIITTANPRTEIAVFVEVLQADGGAAAPDSVLPSFALKRRWSSHPCVLEPLAGVRAACFNAVTIALIDAGIPMKDFLVACTTGFVDGTPVVGE